MSDPLFQNPWITVDTVDAVTGTGQPYQHTRITTSPGAVVLPFTRSKGRVLIGLVQTVRPVLNDTLVELPRGGTDDRSREEAFRELGEEFGLGDAVLSLPYRYLGDVIPDSGIMNHRVDVWTAYLDAATVEATNGFREDETGGVVLWWTVDALRVAIKDGTVRDSFTLSALLLAELNGVFDDLGR